MWIQFFLENVHFAINLFVALVIFAVFWLYFDAWTVKKALRGVPMVLGFILLAISFALSAVFIETTILSTSVLGNLSVPLLVTITRIPGYVLIITALISDPLQDKPLQGEPKK